MPTFIKAGFWEQLCKSCRGYKGWLNLDQLIESKIPPAPQPTYKELFVTFFCPSGSIIILNIEGDYKLTASVIRNSVGNYRIDLGTTDNTSVNFVLTSTSQSGGSTNITSGGRIGGGPFVGQFSLFKKEASTGNLTDADLSTMLIRIYP